MREMTLRPVLFFTFFVLFWFQGPVVADQVSGRVVGISDGDTITILESGNIQHKIRLQGIDAPEQGQPLSRKSKSHLSELVAGKEVSVMHGKHDRYGRIVGKVLLGDTDVCLAQVRAGLAWHYKKYAGEQNRGDRIMYAGEEEEARRTGIGLWAEPDPVPPWEWRQGRRQVDPGTRSEPEPFKCGTKRYCKQMTSCKEARFYLRECGLGRLDGDSDGIPCEALCGH